ncbi:MAG: DMT family transporter [Gemmatimonadota bacterium]|nr:DMT family transporter [Gemmatimonadota bacterium]
MKATTAGSRRSGQRRGLPPLLSTGLTYMALAAFWFSVMSLLVKLAGQRLHTQQIVLARAVVSLALSYVLLRRAGLGLWGSRPALLLLRGALGFVALSCFYYALVHLPLADATVLQYTNPIFTALLAAWLLRERIGVREAALVLFGMAGVLLIARPSFLFGERLVQLDPLVVAVALAGALFSAGAYVTVRRLGATEHPLVIVFYFPLVTIPASLPFAAARWVWPTPLEWLVLLGVGIATQIGQIYLTKGLQLEPAGRATAVGYLQIVFAAVWGLLFFAERPDAWSLAGALLIIGSTLALARKRGRRRQTPPPAPLAPESSQPVL